MNLFVHELEQALAQFLATVRELEIHVPLLRSAATLIVFQ
jgi:hypothetical protein